MSLIVNGINTTEQNQKGKINPWSVGVFLIATGLFLYLFGVINPIKTFAANDTLFVNSEYLSSECGGDHTTAFQKALNSDYNTVVIEKLPNNEPWSIGQVVIQNKKKEENTALKLVKFSENVTIQADINSFISLKEAEKAKGKDLFSLFLFSNASMIAFEGSENVTFTCDSEKFNASGIKVIGVNIRSSNNVTVQGITISNMTYDGVYVGYGSQYITIQKISSLGNTRQAMSVTSATNLDILDSNFENTKFLKISDDEGNIRNSCGNGLVFEVNEVQPMLETINIKRCTFYNNQVGLSFSVSKATNETKPISINVENCAVKNNATMQIRVSEWATTAENAVDGRITFTDVTADGLNPLKVNMGKLSLTFNNFTAQITSEEFIEKNTNPLVKIVQTMTDSNANFKFNGSIHSNETEGKISRLFAYSTKNEIQPNIESFGGNCTIVRDEKHKPDVEFEIKKVIENPNAKISQVVTTKK